MQAGVIALLHIGVAHCLLAVLSVQPLTIAFVPQGTNSFREGSFVTTTTTTTITTTTTTLSSGGVGRTSPPDSAMAQHYGTAASSHPTAMATGSGHGDADEEMYNRRSDPMRPAGLPAPSLGDLGTGAYALPGTPPPSAPSLLQVRDFAGRLSESCGTSRHIEEFRTFAAAWPPV